MENEKIEGGYSEKEKLELAKNLAFSVLNGIIKADNNRLKNDPNNPVLKLFLGKRIAENEMYLRAISLFHFFEEVIFLDLDQPDDYERTRLSPYYLFDHFRISSSVKRVRDGLSKKDSGEEAIEEVLKAMKDTELFVKFQDFKKQEQERYRKNLESLMDYQMCPKCDNKTFGKTIRQIMIPANYPNNYRFCYHCFHENGVIYGEE
ncbi:MAG: hypothetical protein UR46_C0016G0006 [Parcubacteria group bacterium GW2011_GWA1_33_6]|uniref:Uncharacterized protein n=1 Tax=Candidatus Staskawiczbacteria bacterium RIFCSPHIGHO2_02_FULL_33_16 TaxID=1802204 RepID=A0A1G2I0Q9_9BACT|nr:MAG: hypothetical protein UR46_C0016G0006 [Parcubacteria group bacterium GW2011_GWA1_33_6]OGZ67658.1 MAG: hypothetical protein A3D34_01940 [Candidatus Staskawiczbacteria bacterium RIFCSPHIGHO2_02_FULL_33_16]OGZ70343.1 MAG: hypothetical protein A2980_01770 [Candidatus Staskawiczbacteria bacterium RIFCSPLOWO2_01_FULL_33_13]